MTLLIVVIEYILPWLRRAICLITRHPLRVAREEAIARRKLELAQKRIARKEIVLSYDPTNCGSLERFKTCKEASPCLFAKTAKLWGSPEFDRAKTVHENMLELLPALLKYVSLVEEEEGVSRDGFLIEVRGIEHCKDLPAFAATVRAVLSAISERDPAGLNCINMKSILSPHWHLSLCTVPIFVTTFAPFYPVNSSRYMGELSAENKDSCFILLQPEESFYRHKIGMDTPHTNWTYPETIRDKIRINFREKGRDYYIPSTTSYAAAEQYVARPENTNTNALVKPLVRFWETTNVPTHSS